MDDRPIALEVDRVTKEYTPFALPFLKKKGVAATKLALRGVSFQVRQGETLGLLGQNGAGKTTLLKIITTLVYPTSGQVRLFGEDVYAGQTQARSQMGLVTCDERSFYWRLSGRQNLAFFGKLYGLTDAEIPERTHELLDTLGILDAQDRAYQQYSSGMKQKLAIARGLMAHPRLVFYDEPTRSLDPISTQNIRSWILENRKRNPDQTHVIATNTLSEAEELCDRVVIISRGRIAAQGTIEEIRKLYPAQDVESHRVTFRGPWPANLVEDPDRGLLEVKREAEEGGGEALLARTARDSGGLSVAIRAILDAGGEILRCDSEKISFDEIFRSLVLQDQAEGDEPAGEAAADAEEETR